MTMFTSYRDLIDALVSCRDSNEFRSEPEHDIARRDQLEYVVQTMLEKLARGDLQ
jgi:hypothetical protein